MLSFSYTEIPKHSIQYLLYVNQASHFPDSLCCVAEFFSAENYIF